MMKNVQNEALVFDLSGCSFAAELPYVVETVQALPITGVPMLPRYILGVSNLRGNIIPVIDLGYFFREKAGLAQDTQKGGEGNRCVIVLRCDESVFAVLADNVLRVEDTKKNLLNEGAAPSRGGGFEKYVKASLLDGDGVIFVLDIVKIFTEMTGEILERA